MASLPELSEPVCVLSIDVGNVNLAACALVVYPYADPARDRILHWTLTSLAEPTTAALYDALEPMVDWHTAGGAVLVERQPPQNVRMTRMQAAVEMFFHCQTGAKVVAVDPRLKLDFAASTSHWPRDADTGLWSYHIRKKLSVRTVQALLEHGAAAGHDPDALAAFRAAKKKDDA